MGKHKRPLIEAARMALWPSILLAGGLVFAGQIAMQIEALLARFDSWEALFHLVLMVAIVWPVAFVIAFFYYR